MFSTSHPYPRSISSGTIMRHAGSVSIYTAAMIVWALISLDYPYDLLKALGVGPAASGVRDWFRMEGKEINLASMILLGWGAARLYVFEKTVSDQRRTLETLKQEFGGRRFAIEQQIAEEARRWRGVNGDGGAGGNAGEEGASDSSVHPPASAAPAPAAAGPTAAAPTAAAKVASMRYLAARQYTQDTTPAGRELAFSVFDVIIFQQLTNSYPDTVSKAEQMIKAMREQASDAMVWPRTVFWAIPSVGFLGTVYGIAEGIGKVGATPTAVQVLSANSLDALRTASHSFAVAFHTTLVALVASIVIVFLISRAEKRAHATITRIEKWLIHDVMFQLLAAQQPAQAVAGGAGTSAAPAAAPSAGSAPPIQPGDAQMAELMTKIAAVLRLELKSMQVARADDGAARDGLHWVADILTLFLALRPMPTDSTERRELKQRVARELLALMGQGVPTPDQATALARALESGHAGPQDESKPA